jgi:vacuolar-type H+-ATPase subunit C/Vma6
MCCTSYKSRLSALLLLLTVYCCLLLQAGEPMGRFLDYCTYGHMIDNVVLIVTGTLHERDVQVRCGGFSALPGRL